MVVRCKFVCTDVAELYRAGGNEWKYGFTAVTGDSPENKMFWKYTPSGRLEFNCMTQGPLFEVGKEYYLDVTPYSKEAERMPEV